MGGNYLIFRWVNNNAALAVFADPAAALAAMQTAADSRYKLRPYGQVTIAAESSLSGHALPPNTHTLPRSSCSTVLAGLLSSYSCTMAPRQYSSPFSCCNAVSSFWHCAGM